MSKRKIRQTVFKALNERCKYDGFDMMFLVEPFDDRKDLERTKEAVEDWCINHGFKVTQTVTGDNMVYDGQQVTNYSRNKFVLIFKPGNAAKLRTNTGPGNTQVLVSVF